MMNIDKKIPTYFIPLGIAGLMLLIAALSSDKLPSGFYTLLRLVVCGTSIYLAKILPYDEKKEYIFSKNREQVLGFSLLFIALLFNPIFPIYLYNRTAWRFIDIIVVIFFGYIGYILNKNDKK